MIRVLGIDSAFAKCGWALVERDGVRERLIAHGVLKAVDGEVVGEFAGRMATGSLTIDVVVIEDCYLDETERRNVDTLKVLARLVGRWQQAFEALGLSTTLVMADVWQRFLLTGLMPRQAKREARKAAAKTWARATFKEALGSDESDAVGLAVYWVRKRAFADKCAVA